MRLGGLTLATLSVALALVSPGCSDDASRTSPPPVERIAKQLARDGGRSVIVYVSDDGHEYVATAGLDRPAPDQRFRAGSVSKTFAAAIVLQLVAEGRLRLSDTLERHLPGVVPAGSNITIRQLLQHRSGLASYTDDATWLEQANSSTSIRPIDILRHAGSLPMTFRPGTEWGYSNTNYIALGLVIEKLTGTTYREQLEERLLEPLDLERTELPTTSRVQDLNDPGQNPVVPWAAGALVSDARDLGRFYSALLSGRVLSDDSLSEMQQTIVPEAGYGEVGLGIFSIDLKCGRFWGHSGGILDYATLVQASEDGKRVAVVSVRSDAFTGQPPDEEALLCPSEPD